MPFPSDDFYNRFQDQLVGDRPLPPVEQWNPALCGDISIHIDRQGKWFHNQQPIQRQSLVDLFSSILKREDDDYFLVTPVEKWRIQVDVAPLLVISCRILNPATSKQVIQLQTQQKHWFAVDREHPLWVMKKSGGVYPVVQVRNHLSALIDRNVYYELATHAQQWGDVMANQHAIAYYNNAADEQTSEQRSERLGLLSNGMFFVLDEP